MKPEDLETKPIEIFIYGTLPGLNELINVSRGTKGRGSLLAAATQKKEATNRVAYRIISMRLEPITKPIHVDFLWAEESKRRDPDNIISAKKYCLDGMVKAGLIENDGWKQIDGISDNWVVNKKSPGVLIRIFQV